MITARLGAQWGDEGKGKGTDKDATNYDICARATGGANAGHTVVISGKKYKFHLLPSGMITPGMQCVIGNGVVLSLEGLTNEINILEKEGYTDVFDRLKISDRSHITIDLHKLMEQQSESINKIGTTMKGIGPTYTTKVQRTGIQFGICFNEHALKTQIQKMAKTNQFHIYDIDSFVQSIMQKALPFKDIVIDTGYYLREAYKSGKRILIEGANAIMLDIDHGSYPYVTSSNPSIGGLYTGLGISHKLTDLIGVMKLYCTKVGEGPFPTEDLTEIGNYIRDQGNEYGTSTGRPRRVGALDIPQLKYAIDVCGFTKMEANKVDVLKGVSTIKLCTKYKVNGEYLPYGKYPLAFEEVEVEYEEFPGWEEDISHINHFDNLPTNCKKYLSRVQQLIEIPITTLGVGPERHQFIEFPNGIPLDVLN